MPKLLGFLLVLLLGALMACNGDPAPTPEPTSAQAAATTELTVEPTPKPQLDPTATTPVPPSPVRIDAVRGGLANIRQDHGLDLCEYLPQVSATGRVNGIHAVSILSGWPIYEDLLDIGFPPSWREWVAAQYQAAPNDSRLWPEDAHERWFDYGQKARVAQLVEGLWELIGQACAWPPSARRTVDLTPAILDDAERRLADLQRRHSIDLCGDLEMYGSGLLVVESKVIADYRPGTEDRAKIIGGHTDEAVHAMLDFLVGLGYRPSWREWVIEQITANMFEEDRESEAEYLEETWSETEGWNSLPSKALAAQINEGLWEDVRGLCGLTSTANQE